MQRKLHCPAPLPPLSRSIKKQSQLHMLARKAVLTAREPQAHGEIIIQDSSPLRHLPSSALQQRLLQRAAGVVRC